MIIKPHSTNKKRALIASLILILLISTTVGLAYYYKLGFFASHQSSSINLNKPTDPQIKEGVNIKQHSMANTPSGTKVQSGSDQPPEPKPIDGSSKSTVDTEITATTQDRTTFHIRTLIQAVVSTGTCSLAMSGPAGATYTAQADVQASSTSSTCKGFDIPLSELSSGNWRITINFNNDSLTGSSTKNVTIQ